MPPITPVDFIRAQDLEGLRGCLQAGADPNKITRTASSSDLPALTRAIWAEPPELALEFVRTLLEFGADPNIPESYRPLDYAVANDGTEPILQLFLDAGADPNFTRPGGARYDTALGTAIREGSAEIIRLLGQYGTGIQDYAYDPLRPDGDHWRTFELVREPTAQWEEVRRALEELPDRAYKKPE